MDLTQLHLRNIIPLIQTESNQTSSRINKIFYLLPHTWMVDFLLLVTSYGSKCFKKGARCSLREAHPLPLPIA